MAAVLMLVVGCSSDDDTSDDTSSSGDTEEETPPGNTESPAEDASMSFFITSAGPGDGGNLGGLPGADAYCTTLAEAAGTTDTTWRAYLSTTGADGENARDRIGEGPWLNARGVQVASSVEDLLSDENNLNKETALNESGDLVNGRGDEPNRHDILTGTRLDGTASPEGESATDTTCGNWTSNDEGSALVGHHDRQGLGENPESWSTAHGSSGCSQDDLRGTGGDGLFYCLAID